MVNDTRGFLHLPLALVLAALTTGSVGTWGVLRYWRSRAELQLRLDRCVGSTAQELASRMNSIETVNLEIHVVRASLMPATLLPPVRASLQATLTGLVLYQEGLLASWTARQAHWLVMRGCDGARRDLAVPLPSFEWTRLPPDSLGPNALVWWRGPPESFRVRMGSLPRTSSATVTKEKGIGKSWVARWGLGHR